MTCSARGRALSRRHPGALALLTGVLAGALQGGPPAAAPASAEPPAGPSEPSSPAAPLYQKTPEGLDAGSPALEDALPAVRRLRTRVAYDLDGETVHSDLEGTGFIVEMDGTLCVVTLAHVVGDDFELLVSEHPRGEASWRLRGRRVSARTVIDLPGGEAELQLLHRDEASDLAFFRLPAGAPARPLPFPAGDSGRLRIGDFVYLLGRLEGTDLHVRAGIVSAAGPTARVAHLAGARDAFMISAPLSHGDSGSPVVAIRSGRYELVGIAQGKYESAREAGWVLRINPALAVLRAVLARPATASAAH